MPGAKFSIVVPYLGKYVIAKVEVQNSVLTYPYQVSFPDGFKNIFSTIEAQTAVDEPWRENDLGETELAQQVGLALDMHTDDTYIEPFYFSVNGAEYLIAPFITENDLQTKVFQEGRYLFTMALNDYAAWQVVSEKNGLVIEKIALYNELASLIGRHIEDRET